MALLKHSFTFAGSLNLFALVLVLSSLANRTILAEFRVTMSCFRFKVSTFVGLLTFHIVLS